MPQKASELKAKGVSYRKFSEKIGISTHDIRKSLKELLQSETPEVGRIRKKGGGRKHSLTKKRAHKHSSECSKRPFFSLIKKYLKELL